MNSEVKMANLHTHLLKLSPRDPFGSTDRRSLVLTTVFLHVMEYSQFMVMHGILPDVDGSECAQHPSYKLGFEQKGRERIRLETYLIHFLKLKMTSDIGWPFDPKRFSHYVVIGHFRDWEPMILPPKFCLSNRSRKRRNRCRQDRRN